jgi:uncharacterized protein YgbK (DUF1537 family)
MSDFFVADDLSGALDAAAAFHRAGWQVKIALSPGASTTAAENEMIGFTTETRNAPAEIAAATFSKVITEAQARGGRLRYKKIDSTLRGPVAAELHALAAALPDTAILFAPANPKAGRTVRDGELLIRGVPVTKTEFAQDPLSPVHESIIHRLLGGNFGGRLIIPDTETEADLESAVAKMDQAHKSWIPVGSGALARPVAARMAVASQVHARFVEPVPTGGVLMLCGSAHRVNREQALALGRERGVPVHELRLDDPAPALAAAVASLRSHAGASVLIEQSRGDSAAALRTMARAASDIIRGSGVRRIFATGGETAFALCGDLAISTLHFLREIESGLSVSRGENTVGPLLLAVKPGGFGDAATWVRTWDALSTG